MSDDRSRPDRRPDPWHRPEGELARAVFARALAAEPPLELDVAALIAAGRQRRRRRGSNRRVVTVLAAAAAVALVVTLPVLLLRSASGAPATRPPRPAAVTPAQPPTPLTVTPWPGPTPSPAGFYLWTRNLGEAHDADFRGFTARPGGGTELPALGLTYQYHAVSQDAKLGYYALFAASDPTIVAEDRADPCRMPAPADPGPTTCTKLAAADGTPYWVSTTEDSDQGRTVGVRVFAGGSVSTAVASAGYPHRLRPAGQCAQSWPQLLPFDGRDPLPDGDPHMENCEHSATPEALWPRHPALSAPPLTIEQLFGLADLSARLWPSPAQLQFMGSRPATSCASPTGVPRPGASTPSTAIQDVPVEVATGRAGGQQWSAFDYPEDAMAGCLAFSSGPPDGPFNSTHVIGFHDALLGPAGVAATAPGTAAVFGDAAPEVDSVAVTVAGRRVRGRLVAVSASDRRVYVVTVPLPGAAARPGATARIQGYDAAGRLLATTTVTLPRA